MTKYKCTLSPHADVPKVNKHVFISWKTKTKKVFIFWGKQRHVHIWEIFEMFQAADKLIIAIKSSI